MSCHSDDYTVANFLKPIQEEFGESQHATGDTWVRRGSTNSPECSRCHTNEGHVYYLENGVEAAVSNSSRIHCFTCHAPHTNFDFTLRQDGPATLDRGGTYDVGPSNTCAVCHQVRNPSPDFADGTTLTSKYWGPHHGPQASVLAGSGAYVFAGVTYENDHPHYTLNEVGCVECHMGPVAPDGLAGGHSFKMRYTYHGSESVNGSACTECHTTWRDDDHQATEDVDEYQEAFDTDLDALRQALLALGWIDDTDHVKTGVVMSADAMGAVFNFLILLEDRSHGAHNPVFVESVMEATQAFVDSQTALPIRTARADRR